MAFYKVIKGINDKIGAVLSGINTVFLAAMAVLIFAQVIFRYVLKSPLSWSEELATYLFSLETFLGAAMVLRSNKHVRVTAVLNLIKSDAARRIISVVSDLIILVLCLLLCVASGQIIGKLMKISQISPSMPWLKTSYVYGCVPISMGLMTLIKIESILKTVLKIDDTAKAGREGGEQT